MKATYFLFTHGDEQESLVEDLRRRVTNLPRRSEGAEHAIILTFMKVPAVEGWPPAWRCLTEGIDPDLVIREVHAIQWMHQARLMYRAAEDSHWSFVTVEWKETDEWGEPRKSSSS